MASFLCRSCKCPTTQEPDQTENGVLHAYISQELSTIYIQFSIIYRLLLDIFEEMFHLAIPFSETIRYKPLAALLTFSPNEAEQYKIHKMRITLKVILVIKTPRKYLLTDI